ncbi:MAG: Nif3-like dinuclear metal center hexameric protein [Chthoniobacterales bacterium]
MKLKSIIHHLDTLLKTASIQDYPQAHNGLQLENDGLIERVVVAVDACAAVIEKAVAEKNTLLIVHHGLFWSGLKPLKGTFYQKIKAAMDYNLAIYSSHLPLDFHPELGNNILLARKLDLRELRPALEIQGQLTGYAGQCSPVLRSTFLEKVAHAVGGRVHLAPGGPEKIEKVLVVTGGAGNEVVAAAAQGVDTFVTGEGSHWSYQEAEELGINLIYAGHYATETFGVKALGEYLSEQFHLPWSFIDHPTGL